MKGEQRATFSLVPESEAELDMWRVALTPYSWAEGEFALLITEAAFRQFCSTINQDVDAPEEIKRQSKIFEKRLCAGNFCDVSLEYFNNYQCYSLPIDNPEST